MTRSSSVVWIISHSCPMKKFPMCSPKKALYLKHVQELPYYDFSPHVLPLNKGMRKAAICVIILKPSWIICYLLLFYCLFVLCVFFKVDKNMFCDIFYFIILTARTLWVPTQAFLFVLPQFICVLGGINRGVGVKKIFFSWNYCFILISSHSDLVSSYL